MRLIAILGCCLLATVLQAQPGSSSRVPLSRHTLWLEGDWFPDRSGPTLFSAVGYEYTYGRTPDGYVQAGVRLGLAGGIPLREDQTLFWLVPLTHHLHIGSGAHRFEASIGAAYLYVPGGTSLVLPLAPIVQAGYRYQPRSRGLTWRVHVGSPGIGASVGWAF